MDTKFTINCGADKGYKNSSIGVIHRTDNDRQGKETPASRKGRARVSEILYKDILCALESIEHEFPIFILAGIQYKENAAGITADSIEIALECSFAG